MIGIDTPIERLRLLFVSDLWKTNNYTAYGRAFRNEENGNIIPEVLIASSNEYEDVLLDDKLEALSFFDVDPNRGEENGNQTATVYICFAVNLKKLYPLITERATEYAHDAARRLILQSNFKNITELVTGLAAFDRFTFNENDNMSPFYLFSFTTEINNINNC